MTLEHELHSIATDVGVRAWLHAEQLSPDPQTVSLRGDEPAATASLYKLPLALAWADLVETGEVDPLTPLAMPARDRLPGRLGAQCETPRHFAVERPSAAGFMHATQLGIDQQGPCACSRLKRVGYESPIYDRGVQTLPRSS